MAIAFPNSPTNGQTVTVGNLTYSWSSSENAWLLVTTVATGPTGPTGATGPIGKFVTSDTAPTSPVSGDAWFNSNRGRTYVYYNDGDSAQWVQVGSAQTGAAGVANRNAIINGAFEINQRNFTSTTSSFTYTFDRWITEGNNAGGTITWSAQTFTPGSAPLAGYEGTNFARCVTASLGASNYAVYGQRIEDVRSFANQTVTVSFFARAGSGTPKLGFNLQQNFGSGGSGSVTTLGTPVNLTTSWVRYSVTMSVPSISGKTIGAGNYLFGYLVFSDTIIGTGVGTQNNTFDIWGVQIEPGSSATPFQRNGASIQAELAACQRYYQRVTADNGVFIGGHGGAVTGTIGQATIPLPVTMRVNPTSIDFANISWYNYGNGVLYNSGSFVLQAGQTNYPLVRYTHGSSVFTAGQVGVFSSNATGGFLGFNAEL